MNKLSMEEEENNKEEQGEDIEIVEEKDAGEVKDRTDRLKQERDACRKEKEEYLDGWQRAKAELINYKKDEAKRFEEIIKFANEELLHDILPVLDSFDLAFAHPMSDSDSFEKGIRMIRFQIEDILRRKGVVPIVVKKGDIFDFLFHESIGEIESDATEGTIAEEIQRGYVMNGKVIRASRVKLSKSRK